MPSSAATKNGRARRLLPVSSQRCQRGRALLDPSWSRVMEELQQYHHQRGRTATYDWDAILAPGSRRISYPGDFKCTLSGFCSQLRKEACRRNKLRKDNTRLSISLNVEDESNLVVTVQIVTAVGGNRPQLPDTSKAETCPQPGHP